MARILTSSRTGSTGSLSPPASDTDDADDDDEPLQRATGRGSPVSLVQSLVRPIKQAAGLVLLMPRRITRAATRQGKVDGAKAKQGRAGTDQDLEQDPFLWGRYYQGPKGGNHPHRHAMEDEGGQFGGTLVSVQASRVGGLWGRFARLVGKAVRGLQ
ncbi:hypothetical protein ColTof4_01349 [Colletotrichum tofieldiae]|nr:hypothetical protein ColTof3_08603 [Colletotrichum tofieldiae]GKT68926.1 hypothetical protein ColTof4_01349 [Colletotrichum tofieldiae]GKT96785.1 hypothetical protein Ct61P_14635 [Colletotrichum tofieldiae]